MTTTATEVARAVEAHPWDEGQARGVAHKCVENMRQLFDAFHDLSGDDLVAEGVEAIRRHHAKFNPAKASYATYAYMCARGRLLDLHRSRSRRLRHEKAYAAMRTEIALPDELPGEPDAHEPLEEWVARVFALARRAHRPGAAKRGRKWFSVPQCIAATMLMQHMSLSTRAAAHLVKHDDRLRHALRMTRAPSRGWFLRAAELTKLLLDARGYDIAA